jgi:hypothetical protein
MRLVGDKDNEGTWQGKIATLGPFCLLFWDDPFNRTLSRNVILYRGSQLIAAQMEKYFGALNNKDEYGSFQSFTSCSRNRAKADQFGNCLFIMKVDFAFITDISPLSEYPGEEEEVITPGVCFRVPNIQFDREKTKHIIYLNLRQRFSGEHNDFFVI